MVELPAHIVAQVQRLADEGKPVEEIAFMLRLSERVVKKVLSDAQKKGLRNSDGKQTRTPASLSR